jgi:uncharacterized membrane protein
MERSARSLLLSVAILALLVPASPLRGQDLDAWNLGIMYPGDDAETPFEISRDGTVRVEFFVENSGFVEIELEFEYEIPFGGEHDAPESAIVAAGSNETFDLKVNDVDVFNFEARQEDSFSITATVIARQGVPDPLNTQQSEEGDLVIPTIYDLSIEVDDPLGPMNAGTETILRVSITNTGNVQDKAGDVEVSDDCPLLTTDNGLDELMIGNIMPGKSKQADLKVKASESHPKRHCDVTVTVSSNGAMNSGESVVVSDEVRVSVEPPLTNNEETSEEDDPDDPEEVLSSNLPAPGVLTIILGFIAALPQYSKKLRKRK